MATFAIYTYKFRDVENIGFFEGEENHDPLPTLQDKQDFIENIFREDKTGKRPLECRRYTERKNKETQERERTKYRYKHQTVWENNGIIVLMISNLKKITRHENFQKLNEPDEPWCHVVIDNRPGREFVAIEKNTAFKSQDTVADILCHTLRDRLLPHHVTIEIKNQYQPSAFWSVVSQHRNAGIQQVAFYFAAPNNPWCAGLIGSMNSAAEQMHARPTAVFSSPDGDPIEVEQTNEELRKYVEACAMQGEDITVKVIGIRAPIHIKKVKDKYVLKNMDTDTFKSMLQASPELFDEDYSAVAVFLNQIKTTAEQ